MIPAAGALGLELCCAVGFRISRLSVCFTFFSECCAVTASSSSSVGVKDGYVVRKGVVIVSLLLMLQLRSRLTICICAFVLQPMGKRPFQAGPGQKVYTLCLSLIFFLIRTQH